MPRYRVALALAIFALSACRSDDPVVVCEDGGLCAVEAYHRSLLHTYSEDPYCVHPPASTTPVFHTAFVGLFLEDGTPVCTPDAVVTITQTLPAPLSTHMATLPFNYGGIARLTSDGAMHLFSGPAAPCNVYSPSPSGDDYSWGPCWPRIEYTAQVPGCEPVAGTFTWNDNWFPWKTEAGLEAWQDWYVPILLHCSDPPPWPPVDASVPLTPDASVAPLPDASGP